MNEIFKDFNEVLDLLGFGRPQNIVYHACSTKDIMPAIWSETEEGYKCIGRAVGINDEDLKVTLRDNAVHVEGKTVISDDEFYSTEYDLPISTDVFNNIKGIKYKTRNGMVTIYLAIDRPKKKEVKIEKID